MVKIKPILHLEGYLTRWRVIPKNRFLNIYLHKLSGNDDDRFLHDHPWNSFSILLRGELIEFYLPVGYNEPLIRTQPRFCYRKAPFAHRLVLGSKKPAWTLFIMGPKFREWGFLCPDGWRHWTDIVPPEDRQIEGRD